MFYKSDGYNSDSDSNDEDNENNDDFDMFADDDSEKKKNGKLFTSYHYYLKFLCSFIFNVHYYLIIKLIYNR